jgi:hypothetical protein
VNSVHLESARGFGQAYHGCGWRGQCSVQGKWTGSGQHRSHQTFGYREGFIEAGVIVAMPVASGRNTGVDTLPVEASLFTIH